MPKKWKKNRNFLKELFYIKKFIVKIKFKRDVHDFSFLKINQIKLVGDFSYILQ